MKTLLILALFGMACIPCKAQFFEKLADKVVNAASNSIEKKVEEKSTEYTEKAADAAFDSVEGKSEKKEKKGRKENEERLGNTSSDTTNQQRGSKTFLITQDIFEKNAMALTTNKIPELDKVGTYLSQNPNTRAVISAHVETDEDATDLSEWRAIFIKQILVRKFELNEDFISIEISSPGKPNNRNVEIQTE